MKDKETLQNIKDLLNVFPNLVKGDQLTELDKAFDDWMLPEMEEHFNNVQWYEREGAKVARIEATEDVAPWLLKTHDGSFANYELNLFCCDKLTGKLFKQLEDINMDTNDEPVRILCDMDFDSVETSEALSRYLLLATKLPRITWLIITSQPKTLLQAFPLYYLWPKNVWVGSLIQNQKDADERLPILSEIYASVRFVIVRDLSENLDLTPWIDEEQIDVLPINWVIAEESEKNDNKPNGLIPYVNLLFQTSQYLDSFIAFYFNGFGKWIPCFNGSHPSDAEQASLAPYQILRSQEWKDYPLIESEKMLLANQGKGRLGLKAIVDVSELTGAEETFFIAENCLRLLKTSFQTKGA
jgi:hypothetical protein